jgi:hypothetical protein
MATEPTTLSPVLRRLAHDLGACNVETRLGNNGELISEMQAMGHRFNFRLARNGVIVERFCHQDPATVLSRVEMQTLLELAEHEMARMGRGHLSGERNGRNVFDVLGRAEIKLALTLAGGDTLTGLERTILGEALEKYAASLDGHLPDAPLRGEARTVLRTIHQKLGV